MAYSVALAKEVKTRGFVYGGLLLALGAAIVYASSSGAVLIPAGDILPILLDGLGLRDMASVDPVHQAVLLNIRLPRIVLTLLVGAGLGVSGVALQGLFRNPMADPALIGISAGAALFAAAVIVFEGVLIGTVFQGVLGLYMLPVAAFVGSFLIAMLVLRLSSVSGKTDVATMLLAGIAINAIAQAGTGLMTYLSDDSQLRTLTFWLMGSLSGAQWEQLMVVGPLMLVAIIGLPFQARALNAILLGESVASHLGFDLQRTKLLLIVMVSVCVGSAVAVTGIIGFIGLVVPHMVRLVMGPNHRNLFPLAAILCALVLLLADVASRTVVAPAELPIGIVTALFGGPFFLWLLLKRKAATGVGL